MKNLILLFCLSTGLAAFVAPVVSHSQIVNTYRPAAAKDSLSNTDTTSITIPVDNISRSVELYGLKRTGNVGTCKIYLRATVDGTNYDNIDSLMLTDQVTNYKVIQLRGANGDYKYKTYYAYCLSAGTCLWEPRVYLLRRSN